MSCILQLWVKGMVLVSMLICVQTNHSSMAAVLSFEKKDVKAAVMAETLTNESLLDDSLSDVGVTIFCEVHGIPYFVFSTNESSGCIGSLDVYKRCRFGTVNKINIPVETCLNESVVRCLSANVLCSGFGERQ